MRVSHTCGPKTLISTVAQKCHGNFNLLMAISICWWQFQFTHGNFNYSRQFHFTHSNFNLLTAIFRFAHHLSTTAADSGHQKSKRARKIKSWYLKSIFKVKSENQKSIVDLRTRGYLHETGTNSDRFEFVPRPRGGTLGISGWGCAAGILEPLTYTRASSAEFWYPILE